MIKINRPEKPAFLTTEGNRWEAETLAAVIHYAQDPLDGQFEFSAYRHQELKHALKQIFVKCAYCESIYDQSSDGDIEHFRPKGRIEEKDPKTPGYYWLANDWENLLLSCQHCNQRRIHIIEESDVPLSTGKVDQFPLSDNTKRVTTPGIDMQEEEAVRLLINPSGRLDEPEAHFHYEATRAVMIPLSENGIKSIEVYALKRKALVDQRAAKLAFLFKQTKVVKRALEYYNRDQSNENKKVFNEELDNLLFYTQNEQAYAGMSRYFVRKFLQENNIIGNV